MPLTEAQQHTIAAIQSPTEASAFSAALYAGRLVLADGTLSTDPSHFDATAVNPFDWTLEEQDAQFTKAIESGEIVMLNAQGGIEGTLATRADVMPTPLNVLHDASGAVIPVNLTEPEPAAAPIAPVATPEPEAAVAPVAEAAVAEPAVETPVTPIANAPSAIAEATAPATPAVAFPHDVESVHALDAHSINTVVTKTTAVGYSVSHGNASGTPTGSFSDGNPIAAGDALQHLPVGAQVVIGVDGPTKIGLSLPATGIRGAVVTFGHNLHTAIAGAWKWLVAEGHAVVAVVEKL